MIQINKFNKATRWKLGIWTFLILTVVICGYFVTERIASKLNNITIEFPEDKVVFEFDVNLLPTVKTREMEKPVYVYVEDGTKVELAEVIKAEGDKQDVAQYICDKWGVTQCRTAIAVAKAESGLREEAININTNDTIDVGVFQVNSIHFGKEGCSLKEVSHWKGNVDCAYKIYEQNGKSFNPWVAYWKGSYLAHL